MGAAQTVLNGSISDSVSALTAGDALGFPGAPFVIEIDNERIYVSLIDDDDGTVWTIQRAYQGTAAASHADGAAITCVETAYTSLGLVKADMANAGQAYGTDFDTVIQSKVDAANARILEYVEMFVGPSSDTSRTYDFESCRNRRRLWIRGGIRSVSALTVAGNTNATAIAATIGDVLVRPLASQRLSADYPGTELWLSDVPSGQVTDFYPGYGVIVVTGAFGFASVPPSLVEVATTLAKRMFLSRQSGAGDIVGTSAFGSAIFSRFLSIDDRAVLDWWKSQMSSYGYI